jgi:MFS transporter, DHA1 family, inner membrane transport protein
VTRQTGLLWLLAGVELTLLLDFMVMMPLGPELMQALELSPAVFGATLSVYTIASATVGLLASHWIGRWNLFRLLLWLYAGFIGGSAACALVADAAQLFVARVVTGSCAGLSSSLVMALIVNTMPDRQRGRAVAFVMTSYSVSAVLGVPLGLWAASSFGWRAPFLLVTAVAVVIWVSLAARLGQGLEGGTGTGEGADGSVESRFRSEWLLGWTLTFLVVSAGFFLIPFLGAFMVKNLGVAPSALSLVYLVGGAASFVSARIVGVAVDRFGAARVLAVLLVATVAPFLAFPRLTEPTLLEVIGIFTAFMVFSSGRVIPTVVLVTSRVAPAQRARYLAVNSAISEGASGLGAWSGGWLLATAPNGALVGFEQLASVAVAVTVAALVVLAVIAFRRLERPSEESPSDEELEAA